MELVALSIIIGGVWWLFRRGKNTQGVPPNAHSAPLRIPTASHGRPDAVPTDQAVPAVRLISETALPKPVATPRWIPYGESIEVQGLTIPNGLLYFGTGLKKVAGYSIEPALIDPQLPIESIGAGEDIPYYPNYSEISPASRSAYLRWLIDGRKDESVNPGIVFLYFYGLERRILAEKQHVSDEEWEQIQTEVARLLRVYGQNWSFRRYAPEFLGILSSTRINKDTIADQAPEVTRSWESNNLSS